MSSTAKQRVPECHRCGKPFERKIAAPHVERMKYDGARYDVLIEGMPQWQCDDCEITVTDDDSDTVVQGSLRRHIGLLTADEIRNGRIALELTQKNLAALLGCAPESLSRWENGTILQSRSYDRMLRVFFSVPHARHLLQALDCDKSIGRVVTLAASDTKPSSPDAAWVVVLTGKSVRQGDRGRVSQTVGWRRPTGATTVDAEREVVWRSSSANSPFWNMPLMAITHQSEVVRAAWEPS